MPGRPRSEAEKLSHMVQASRLYLHGHFQHEIAEKLGVSRRTVGYDLRRLHKIWEEMAVDIHTRQMVMALARLDYQEREAFEQWELSKQGTSETTSYLEADESGEPRLARAVARDLEDEGRGDPTWWDRLMRCVEARIQIVETGMPQRLEIGEAGTDWEKLRLIAQKNREQWAALQERTKGPDGDKEQEGTESEIPE